MGGHDEPDLPAAALAVTGYGAYRAAFPTETLRWEQLEDHDRLSWLRLAAWVMGMPAEVDGIAFSDAAARAHARTWADKKTWRTMLEGERVAFEAAFRHIVMLADGGPLEEEDLETLEQMWKAWAQRQRRPVTPVVEQIA